MTEPLQDTSQDTWWLESDAPAKTAETAEERTHRQTIASDRVDHAVHQIAQGMADLNANLANAAEALTDDLAYPELASLVAWLQERKRELGEAEAYLARELGRLEGCPDVVPLPDGRLAEVMKGKARKEWRHDDWKRDVREKVATALGDNLVMDPANGETWPAADVLVELIAQAQAVHGAAAPKVTALKGLELAADDYCSSFPGPYSVRVSAPEASK